LCGVAYPYLVASLLVSFRGEAHGPWTVTLAQPDTNYSYRLVSTSPDKGYTTFVLEMKSQAWLHHE